jgi:hypothetical protein
VQVNAVVAPVDLGRPQSDELYKVGFQILSLHFMTGRPIEPAHGSDEAGCQRIDIKYDVRTGVA